MRANYNSFTDEQLAKLYNQQDRSAFEAIYERYWDVLYLHAKSMLKDEDQAQDVVQDLFIKLLDKMGTIELKPVFIQYLYQSIRFHVLDFIRHNTIKLNHVLNTQPFQTEGEYTTDNQILEKDFARAIQGQVDKLPPKMKAIYEMSRKGYLSNKEIAKATNTSEENIRRQIKLALVKIKAGVTSFICLQMMLGILWINRLL